MISENKLKKVRVPKVPRRVMPVFSEAELQRLLRQPDRSSVDSFFLTADGRPLAKKRVQDRIRYYGRRAGIRTRCSPHTFRSTSAVLYLRNGGDPFTLQEKLGHSTLAMTRRYSVLADSDVMAAHAKYSPVDRLNL